MKTSKNFIGLTLFLLYLLQWFVQVDFEPLDSLQINSTYRHWSGFFLFMLILYQWFLPIYRGVFDMKGPAIRKMVAIHSWLGVIFPLAFYLHSAKPNYGLLLILTVVFFLNLLVGYIFDLDFFRKNDEYWRFVLVAHILLSAAIMVLSLLHIWIVFSYN